MDKKDVVARLRERAEQTKKKDAIMLRGAADEIERLRALLREVRAKTSLVLQSLENGDDELDEDE
jgi:hypothetical protein